MRKNKILQKCVVCYLAFLVCPSQKHLVTTCGLACRKKKKSLENKGREMTWSKKITSKTKGQKRPFTQTIEYKQKISSAMKDYYSSIGYKSKWSDTDKAKQQVLIRSSLSYKIWRKEVFERDDFTCKECGKRGGKLNAHHIKAFSKFPELRTVVDNGVTLCEYCHKLTLGFKNKGNKGHSINIVEK